MKETQHFHFTPVVIMTLLAVWSNAWAAVDLAPDIYDVDDSKTYFPGSNIHVDLAGCNYGTEPSGDYTVRVYASTTCSYTGSPPNVDYFIGAKNRGSVPANSYDFFSVDGPFPNDIPEGRYFMTAVLIYEEDSEPGNNRYSYPFSVKVVIPTPNLMVQSVDVADGYYRPGDELLVNVSIKNLGELDSGSYSIDCYALCNTNASTGSISVGATGSGSLASGQQCTLPIVCELPPTMPEGEYFIEVLVACAGDDDLRNNKASGARTVTVGRFPDLGISSVVATPGTYAPGDTTQVWTQIENDGDRVSQAYTVRYYLSSDTTISTRDSCIGRVECAPLAAGQQKDLAVTCRLPLYVPTGACYVGAIVTSTGEANPRNNQAHDARGITVVHPAGYLCGQARCEDTSGWNHPIRYALVKVYGTDKNSDPTDDPVIGETFTDGDGNYGLRLPSAAAGGADVYVKVFTRGVPGACPGTESGICTVKDAVLKQLYSLRSIDYPYPVTGSVVIPVTSPRTAGEFMVYDSIVEGFEKTREFLDLELAEVPVFWPTSDAGTYYAPGEGIFISKDDRGDRDVILHEYGHYVADSSGFGLGAVGQDPIHYWNLDLRIQPSYRTNQEARNLAFREAWATLFAVATQYGDASYPYAGDTKYQDVDEITRKALVVDLEAVTAAHKSPGEYYECMNAGALWDIFDDTCDAVDNNDTISDLRLARIWATATEAKPSDILDFWNAWFARFGDRREISRVFWDHGMTPKAPVSTSTVETFETGDFRALAWSSTNPPWVVVSEAGHQSTYAAKSGKIGNSQSSTLEITMDCDDGWISFWLKTSCEPSWDPLRFFVDGIKKEEWSGENDWRRVGYSIAGGKHKFTWTFNKDNGAAQGADAVWIDDIEFPKW